MERIEGTAMVDIVHNSIYMALGHAVGYTVGNEAWRNASMALNSFATAYFDYTLKDN